MSVPLDRLYNFLQDITRRDDVIIYRFFPHGSRKIADLTQLDNNVNLMSVELLNCTQKIVIFHDQEPLSFDLYSSPLLADELRVNLPPEYNEELFQKYKNLVSRIIDRTNLKLIAGTIMWDIPAILVHSEKQSTELARYEQIKCIGVYWWSHALIAADWFRYADIDPMLNQRQPSKDFLIYNRAWGGTREYRIKFAELLVDYGLVDQCRTWFSGNDRYHYIKHQFQNPHFTPNNTNLEQVFKQSDACSNSSADYCVDDYISTNIEVVLETLFDDLRLHLTEKTLRPIACGQPFMLAATPGSLEYLRSYGFKTFHGIIDETYDTIIDPMKRMHSICTEMQRISQLPLQEKTKLFADLRAIAAANKKLFFSDEWQQHIISEYQQNFKLAVESITPVNKVKIKS